MMYIQILMFGSTCFLGGWVMKSMSVSNLIKKAKKDIKYVDTLKSEAYSKGWNTGYGYRDCFER